jgi:hypothetical protein
MNNFQKAAEYTMKRTAMVTGGHLLPMPELCYERFTVVLEVIVNTEIRKRSYIV